MANIVRTHSYNMGLKVDGVAIPDPSVFDGAASALDSMGNRDGTGTLHRKMVAEKHSPIEIEYHSISYKMMETIMSKMRGEYFDFTFPDPADGLVTIKGYVGDRKWTTQIANGEPSASGTSWKNQWFGNLTFHIMEY